MSDEKIVSYTSDELKKRRAQGVPTETDWERVKAITDEEFTQAIAQDPDATPSLDEEFWRQAIRIDPRSGDYYPIPIRSDILAYFMQQGREVDCQAAINSAQSEYIQTRRKSKSA